MLRIAKALYAWGMVDADERILRLTVDLWVEALGLAIRSLEHGRFEGGNNVARVVFR